MSLVLGLAVLAVIELLALVPFTKDYMADKGLLLTLAVLFLLSSLAFAAVAGGLKILFDRCCLRGRASLLAGLAGAGLLNSAVLGLVVTSYSRELLMVWETLAVVLSVSNVYGFMAIELGDINTSNLHVYMFVNALTLAIVPWVLADLWSRRHGLRGFFDTVRVVAVAVALAVKPVVYLILLFWLVAVF